MIGQFILFRSWECPLITTQQHKTVCISARQKILLIPVTHCNWIIYIYRLKRHLNMQMIPLVSAAARWKRRANPHHQTVDMHHLFLRANWKLVPHPNLSEQQKQRTPQFP